MIGFGPNQTRNLEILQLKCCTVLLSTPQRSVGDVVRIMAVDDSTSVSTGDGTSRTLNTAEFAELDVASGTYLSIESDKVQ